MSRNTGAEGKQSSEAEINLDDKIGMFGITAKDFIDGLKEIGNVDTINVHISSGGGSVIEGHAIFNALQRHESKVVIHIDSLAASMASVIAMAGDEIRMAANALFMIHNPWTMSMGDADQLRKDAKLLDKMQANIRNSYSRSNLSSEEIEDAMNETTWFTAEEALEAGFIDSIGEENLAAASIEDFETSKNFDLPRAKIDGIKIKCQEKQLEILNDKLADITEEFVIAKAQIKTSDDLAEVVTSAHKAQLELMNDLHKSQLKEATEKTQKDISDKAAEVIESLGVPPVDETINEGSIDEPAKKMTPEDFWKTYHDLQKERKFIECQDFYSKNKHVLEQILK
tara:strand:+ start:5590 stop:6612 length:1023 start_codon:yes stop_codon:yes gene_type:complete